MDDNFWQTKLAARLHDPIEKALVLLRDPEGHENGTSRALRRLLGLERLPEQIDPDNDEALCAILFKKGLPIKMYRHVQRADWWAAAADRPQWPLQETTLPSGKTLAIAPWARVNWANHPVLIHPLTGAQYDLTRSGSLKDTDIANIKQKSFEHFSRLLKAVGITGEAPADWRKILLTFWRFGPEPAEEEDSDKLGELWKLLPADTRVPDHSIWDHLDLASAFAGAFAADPEGEPALLVFAIGPVQPFIAAARKMEDLWAGSHLLSRLAWEAMRPLCEELGPDAVLFPRLRGIAQVDVWLRDRMGLPDALFAQCDWMRSTNDANPLFCAALPNRFVALVPAARAKALAEVCTQAVRQWLRNLGNEVVSRLLDVAGYDVETTHTPYAQLEAQLAGFPEVHWAAVPFSLIQPRDVKRQTDLDVASLLQAMAPFFDVETGKPCGFLATPAWQVLQKEIDWGDGVRFLSPNPGVLYPAVYDLAERLLAAAKTLRPFDQSKQEGWRDSLAGEAEWLTTDRSLLAVPAGKRKSRTDEDFNEREHVETLWTKIADRKPAWAKKGEHLGALGAIKRLWPTIYAEEVGKALAAGERGEQIDIARFVVSTHTMALAHQLDQWLERGGLTAEGTTEAFNQAEVEPVALPRRLVRRHAANPALKDAKRLPALLDAAREDEPKIESELAQKLVKKTLARPLDKQEIRLETYYALLLMDGDRMGAILSGDEEHAISYRDSFHPHLQEGFNQQAAKHPLIGRYGQQKRPISPNRHLAISAALNDFSQIVVRHVVEEEHLGRVIYAGGDDVLAMLPIADLLSCMQRLRQAYSGVDPEHEGGLREGLTLANGFAALSVRDGKGPKLEALMRMMGERATASTGVVIAHHQAPLSAVMRELRAAETRAKDEGGRNAFTITILKRSGSQHSLTAKWGEPLKLLVDLRDFLAAEHTSRRAVYHSVDWLDDLPEPHDNAEMLNALLAYQFARQSQNDPRAHALAKRLVELCRQQKEARAWLINFLITAEFLAREHRA